MTDSEQFKMASYLSNRAAAGFVVPPAGSVRNMAEWEEVQAVVVTWRSYKDELAQIVQAAQEECLVLVNCTDSVTAKAELSAYGFPLTQVQFNQVATNSVWIRDYGPNCVYLNDVDSLYIVDWIYNRPRPDDDLLPVSIAEYFNLPLYQTIQSPYAVIHTGGNFMSDGLGTAFSEKLTLEENPDLDEPALDSIMNRFMGISRYIKIENLPYDGIHHIDMHMKLLDEQTLLVGEFPENVSDGPQIEANLQYILANYPSFSGAPYRVVRIPMVPSTGGNYPPDAYYRTYANGVFINKSYLVPTYYEQFDTTALRILEENLPGYTIVPINSQDMISASGAIHCITHTIGVADPLLIAHHPYPDTLSTVSAYKIQARIQHQSGIQLAEICYCTSSDTSLTVIPMQLTDSVNKLYEADIQAVTAPDTVHYFIRATAQSGKVMTRPITAPEGFWDFSIKEYISVPELSATEQFTIHAIYPNPCAGISCIPVSCSRPAAISIELYNLVGQLVTTIYRGNTSAGTSNYFVHAKDLPAGTYLVEITVSNRKFRQKLIVSPTSR